MITRLKQVLSGEYLRNVGWMAGAELANRIIRLSTTVVLARMFSPHDYGLMAIIFTICDFSSAFTLRGGVGSKIIQADERDVKAICNTAYWLNWITCGSLFIIQCFVAFLIPYFSHDRELTIPLCIVALTYLTYPLWVIHLTLIERENRFKSAAICNVLNSLISNILTATFALLGMGIGAITWPLLIACLFWIVITWKFHPWRPPLRFSLERWREVIGFGSNLLIADLLSKFQANVDYLLVGKYLGVQALGMYYFAFNAGSGITLNLMNTFMVPLYPHICGARNDYWQFKHRYFNSLKKATAILVPLILLQAALAPIYVPIVFGKKWIPAIPVLILICLSVIPRIYARASSLLLNAIDKTIISLFLSVTFTVIFVISLLAVVKNGILWVACAVFFSHLIVLSIFTIWTNRYALSKKHFLNLSNMNL
ncbi:lipopolysaccharide biosynthesis protein [Nostoc sp. UHCC 0251]|uniref:lipopolysaccharide biosynthesis protein n=1 Tax=Nostoc sp. UHCC 0251 TaxID=3110240 RepID=UPI002B207119|nr:lipopolysaccharide biosynthesis protein [Nostoc sp. UHCC 0251]MEA5622623.1 lipopolysaccharide biosynthesis protein [Nostoc sp. UHCC 0251]